MNSRLFEKLFYDHETHKKHEKALLISCISCLSWFWKDFTIHVRNSGI